MSPQVAIQAIVARLEHANKVVLDKREPLGGESPMSACSALEASIEAVARALTKDHVWIALPEGTRLHIHPKDDGAPSRFAVEVVDAAGKPEVTEVWDWEMVHSRVRGAFAAMLKRYVVLTVALGAVPGPDQGFFPVSSHQGKLKVDLRPLGK